MEVMGQRLPLLMILIWYGFRRGWWYSLSETPLMQLDTFNTRAEQDIENADDPEGDDGDAGEEEQVSENPRNACIIGGATR